jgi:hypothetical protein
VDKRLANLLLGDLDCPERGDDHKLWAAEAPPFAQLMTGRNYALNIPFNNNGDFKCVRAFWVKMSVR